MRQRVRGGVVTLTNIKTVFDRKGRARHYLRVKGKPLVRLPDSPMDSPDFLAAWAAAMKASTGHEPRPGKGSIAALCTSYLRSYAFKEHSASYQILLRRHVCQIEAKAGDRLARDLKPIHIKADLAALAPAVAKQRYKAWRVLAKHGDSAGLLTTDPTIGVKRPDGKSVDIPAWTRDDIAAFRARWAVGTAQRAIFELLFWTGARVSDAVRIGPGMIGRDGVLVFRQVKTKGEAYVPWTCALPAFADQIDRDHMLAAIAPLAGHMTFLATREGRGRSAKSIGGDVSAAARAAGVQKSAHGLRKSRCAFNADGGATATQIASWTGHESLSEVTHYTKSADRRRAVMGQEQEQNVGKPNDLGGKRA